MKTENLQALKIHKLSKEQHEREKEAGRLDASALYLTPAKNLDSVVYAYEDTAETATTPVNADTLGGKPAGDYATEAFVENAIENNRPTPTEIGAAPSGFGVGEYIANNVIVADADNATKTGKYKIDNTTTNGIGVSATMDVIGYGNTLVIQTAYAASSNVIKRRQRTDSGWSSWESFINAIGAAPAGDWADKAFVTSEIAKAQLDGNGSVNLEGFASSTVVNAHITNKNNPHEVTIGQIGAAPAGYGLGTTCQNVSNLEDIRANGWWLSNVGTPDGAWWLCNSLVTNSGSDVILDAWRFLGGGRAVRFYHEEEDKETGELICTWSDWENLIDFIGAVPSDRKINNKPLSSDITLIASDVGARPDTWMPTASDVGAAASSHGNHVPATQTASNKVYLRNDNTWHVLTPSDIGAVPTTTTVNGKALSSNISLSASDVGAVPTSRTVNGKALSSNITLKPGDIGITKLWANTKPTSTFGAQTVCGDANLGNYDYVLVAATFDVNNPHRTAACHIATVGGSYDGGYLCGRNPSSGVYVGRSFDVSTSGVTFAGGYTGTTANDKYCIPFAIFGIKF